MHFPQYRKYKNQKSYFRINSPESFDEITVLGNTYTQHHFTAMILPDRNFIQDMLHAYSDSWEASGEEEFLTMLGRVKE